MVWNVENTAQYVHYIINIRYAICSSRLRRIQFYTKN